MCLSHQEEPWWDALLKEYDDAEVFAHTQSRARTHTRTHVNLLFSILPTPCRQHSTFPPPSLPYGARTRTNTGIGALCPRGHAPEDGTLRFWGALVHVVVVVVVMVVVVVDHPTFPRHPSPPAPTPRLLLLHAGAARGDQGLLPQAGRGGTGRAGGAHPQGRAALVH